MDIINLLDSPEHSISLLKKKFSEDVLNGLTAKNKEISSKYFYDNEGSQLFKRITALDEYYLTRAELGILQSLRYCLPEILQEDVLDIIELGMGDGHKSAVLMKGLIDKNCVINYFPIDISAHAFELLQENLNGMGHYQVKGIIGDYLQGLNYTSQYSSHKQLVLFMGSNIGNFNPQEAGILLKNIASKMKAGDYLLIGFDLKKDVSRMLKAYDDSAGVTREFNLNLLKRINRELGGTFDTNAFQHLAFYNPRLGAMESHLLSLTPQTVMINELDLKVDFESYESIHLECSFKFNEADIERLCVTSGFELIEHFADPLYYFIDSLWQVKK